MPKADPLRSCLGCRVVKPKTELLRFVADPEGLLCADVSRKLPGRGAYTCFSRSCLEIALKKGQFSRTFKRQVSAPAADELAESVLKRIEERVLSLVALANRAGQVVSGSDKVISALKKGGISVLILAQDTSADSSNKFAAIARVTAVRLFTLSDKERLGALLGKEVRTAVAVSSGSFATQLEIEIDRYMNFFEKGAR